MDFKSVFLSVIYLANMIEHRLLPRNWEYSSEQNEQDAWLHGVYCLCTNLGFQGRVRKNHRDGDAWQGIEKWWTDGGKAQKWRSIEGPFRARDGKGRDKEGKTDCGYTSDPPDCPLSFTSLADTAVSLAVFFQNHLCISNICWTLTLDRAHAEAFVTTCLNYGLSSLLYLLIFSEQTKQIYCSSLYLSILKSW